MRGIRVVCALLAVACLPLAARAQEDEDEEGGLGEAILETRVDLQLDKATVRQVVEVLAEKAGMQYMAVDEALDMEKTVTLHIRGRTVNEVLEFLENRLDLDVDWDRLDETGVLIMSPARRGEGDEGDEGDEPQIDEEEAMAIIRSHPTVAALVKRRPGIEIEVEWDGEERCWWGMLSLDDEEIGHVELREPEDEAEEPRIVEIEIDHDAIGPAGRERNAGGDGF